ncbi:MAG: hypothetical protein ABW101_00275 [Candidatus Thiodiazotropha sp.]
MKLKTYAYITVVGSALVLSALFALEKYQDRKHLEDLQSRDQANNLVTNALGSTSLDELRNKFFKVKSYYSSTQDVKWDSLPVLTESDFWYQKEKKRFDDLAQGSRYDVIVLPIQEFTASVDRVSRLLSARYLADELAKRTGLKVMPVELFVRIFGERSFRFSDSDVQTLAKKYGVRTIISPYLRVEKKNLLNQTYDDMMTAPKGFYLDVAMTESGDITQNIALQFVHPEATTTIEALVHDHLAEIVTKLNPEAHIPAKAASITKAPAPKLPERLTDLLTTEENPIRQAFNLQLLGMLTSRFMEYERRRLFERSLVILDGVDIDSSHVRLLKARALFNLFRRPAALDLLANSTSTAEKAYKEYLNGNYPSLKKLTYQLEDDMLRLFSYLELSELKVAYGIDENLDIPVELPSTAWDILVTSGAKDSDMWFAPSNEHFFMRLKGLFSDFDTEYESIIREKSVAGNLNKSSNYEDQLFEIAYEKVWSKSTSTDCCEWGGHTVTQLDLATFYRNLGLSNLIRNLNKMLTAQGAYASAVSTARSYETLFNGNIAITSRLAQGYATLASKSQGKERSNEIDIASRYAEQALRLVGGTDKDSDAAGLTLWMVSKIGGKSVVNARNGLGPSAAYYRADSPSVYVGDYRNNVSSFLSLTRLFSAKDPGLNSEMLDKELKGRFDGHPDKVTFLAERLLKNNDISQANKLLEDEVKQGSRSWKPYLTLGEQMLKESQYQEAFETFSKYPLFHEEVPENRVAVSNHAYKVGSELFWLGKSELAKPFYRIAVGLHTGAGSELASAQRLEMLDGNFTEAAYYAYKRGNRYNSIFGYRDYLAFLFLLGYSDQAFAGFNELAPRYDEPQLWTAILIGQRIAGLNTDSLNKWMEDYRTKISDNPTLVKQLERYAFLQSVTDRPILDTEDNPLSKAWRYQEPFDKTQVYSTYHLLHILDETVPENPTFGVSHYEYLPDGKKVFVKAEEWIKPNYYQTIYSAYSLLRDKKYNDSYKVFLENLKNYGFGIYLNEWHVFIHPYLSIAAVKSGHEKELLEYFNKNRYLKKDDFDYLASISVISAIKGDIDKSLSEMERAFNVRPYTLERPMYTWYEIVDLCEWMYWETGDHRYIDKALEWSKDYQVIQPQFAWAYSFEAKYSTAEKDRIRAAAFALYLDPHSHWLESVPEMIKVQAKEWWKTNNPFVERKEESGV